MHPGSPAYHSTPCALSVIYMQRAGGSTIMYSRNRAWNSQSLYHVCNHAITLSLTQSTLNHHKMTAHARISNHAITQSRNHALQSRITPTTNHSLQTPNTKHQPPITHSQLPSSTPYKRAPQVFPAYLQYTCTLHYQSQHAPFRFLHFFVRFSRALSLSLAGSRHTFSSHTAL